VHPANEVAVLHDVRHSLVEMDGLEVIEALQTARPLAPLELVLEILRLTPTKG
jgi:hypothetical protein